MTSITLFENLTKIRRVLDYYKKQIQKLNLVIPTSDSKDAIEDKKAMLLFSKTLQTFKKFSAYAKTDRLDVDKETIRSYLQFVYKFIISNNSTDYKNLFLQVETENCVFTIDLELDIRFQEFMDIIEICLDNIEPISFIIYFALLIHCIKMEQKERKFNYYILLFKNFMLGKSERNRSNSI